MGRDKALLPWAGTTLLDHALARLRTVCREVAILSGPEPRYPDRGVREVLDQVPGCGPLAALQAALAAAGGAPVLLLAVDLPLVPVPLLQALARRVAEADAVVPVSDDGPQPLCAAYGARCRGPVERALREGRRKMTAFWDEVHVAHLQGVDLAPFGPAGAVFRNTNTPADYADIIDPWRERGPR